MPGGAHGRAIDVFVTLCAAHGVLRLRLGPVGMDVVQLRTASYLAVVGDGRSPHQERLWGSSVVADGGWLYLFGRDYTAGPSTYLARVRARDLQRRLAVSAKRPSLWSWDPGRAAPAVTALAVQQRVGGAPPEDGLLALAIAKDRAFDAPLSSVRSARRAEGPGWAA